jgi:hypothetical protein
MNLQSPLNFACKNNGDTPPMTANNNEHQCGSNGRDRTGPLATRRTISNRAGRIKQKPGVVFRIA